ESLGWIMRSEVKYVSFGSRILKLTNLSKKLFPSGFTKGDVIAYYREIAPAVLPHLEQRPLTLKRYPDGAMQAYFYEKKCPQSAPGWLATAKIEGVRYCVINDLPSLVWTANLASIELHVSLSCAEDMPHPTCIVFDLDPGEPAGLLESSAVALRVRT